jgi:hypothetical protein
LSLQFAIASAGVFTLCWSSHSIFSSLIQGVIVIKSFQKTCLMIQDSSAEQTTPSTQADFAIPASFKTVSFEFVSYILEVSSESKEVSAVIARIFKLSNHNSSFAFISFVKAIFQLLA